DHLPLSTAVLLISLAVVIVLVVLALRHLPPAHDLRRPGVHAGTRRLCPPCVPEGVLYQHAISLAPQDLPPLTGELLRQRPAPLTGRWPQRQLRKQQPVRASRLLEPCREHLLRDIDQGDVPGGI